MKTLSERKNDALFEFVGMWRARGAAMPYEEWQKVTSQLREIRTQAELEQYVAEYNPAPGS